MQMLSSTWRPIMMMSSSVSPPYFLNPPLSECLATLPRSCSWGHSHACCTPSVIFNFFPLSPICHLKPFKIFRSVSAFQFSSWWFLNLFFDFPSFLQSINQPANVLILLPAFLSFTFFLHFGNSCLCFRISAFSYSKRILQVLSTNFPLPFTSFLTTKN